MIKQKSEENKRMLRPRAYLFELSKVPGLYIILSLNINMMNFITNQV